MEEYVSSDENESSLSSLEEDYSETNLNFNDNMSSPEDIANDAFRRIFREVPNFETVEERQLFFNQKGETTAGHVCLKSFLSNPTGIKQQRASRSEQSSPKRHKSPASRHSPFVKRRLLRWESLNSIRKTRSSALPTRKWKSRGVTASTPDLKMVDRNIGIELNPGNNERVHNSGRGNYISYRTSYCNLELFNIILNCVIMAISLIYFAYATVIASNKDIFLIILNSQVYMLSLFSLYMVSIILLVLAFGGLCFTHQSSRKTITHCFAALSISAILVSLALFENSIESQILMNVESQMLSTIQYKPMSRIKDVWDYLHKTFKCCGVRGYLDWCSKTNFDLKKNLTGKEFLGSLVCTPPSSCCLDYKSNTEMNYSTLRRVFCLQLPTPWNSYQIGCILPIKSEIYFVGRIYKITNFGLTIILMISATISFIQFTHF